MHCFIAVSKIQESCQRKTWKGKNIPNLEVGLKALASLQTGRGGTSRRVSLKY